jgi:hypothetical protein
MWKIPFAIELPQLPGFIFYNRSILMEYSNSTS